MRVNVYSPMHKAQRTRMFDLATKISKADFSETAATDEIRSKLLQITENLRRHAHYEENFIHPLLEEGGAEIQEILKDLHEVHIQLEALADKFEEAAKGDLGNSLYEDFNRMIGIYLLHIDKEEALQKSFLWTHFDDARLAGAMDKALKSTPPHETMENLGFLLPCLNTSEAAGFLRIVKAGAPLPAFQAACAIAQGAFSTEEWQKIEAGLA